MSRYRAFGLHREPFAPEPDLAMMAPALGQIDALARLRQALLGHTGLSLVTGESGVGKTLLRLALGRDLRLEPSLAIAELATPAEWRTDLLFLRAVAHAFSFSATGRSMLDLTTEVQRALGVLIAEDRWPLLLIDDAHQLTSSQIDLVRSLLGPDERAPRLSVVLLGEPEIEERINRRLSLVRQLAMRHALNPLNAADAAGLIRFRLHVAGADPVPELFTPPAIAQLVESSGGNPRMLITLAAAAMDRAAAQRRSFVDQEHVLASFGSLNSFLTRGGSVEAPGPGKR